MPPLLNALPGRGGMTLLRCGVSFRRKPSIGSLVGFNTRTARRFSPPAPLWISSVTSNSNGVSPPSYEPAHPPFSHTSAR